MSQESPVNNTLPFILEGTVVYGQQFGRKLGFPTANLGLDAAMIFPLSYGVYAVNVQLGHQSIHGIANAGVRPTLDGTRFQLEVHLFDFDEDIYGKTIEVTFLHFLRPEKRFNNPQELADQIGRDVELARKLLLYSHTRIKEPRFAPLSNQ
jgi:riboflavin kinase/FMN adenylyltransferase